MNGNGNGSGGLHERPDANGDSAPADRESESARSAARSAIGRGRKRRPLDIAIVGMACRFPGAPDLATYWANLLAAHDATSEVPRDRWDPDEFCDPSAPALVNDRVPCRRGGYLEGPLPFDPSAFGIMPVAVEGGEPEQFLVLEAAQRALLDAGLPEGVPDGRRVEVVIGRGNYFNRGNLVRLQHGRIVSQTLQILRALHPEWSDAEFDAIRMDLKSSLPPFGADTITGQITNATAGRVASRLNFRGASFVVDAASASSLVALDLGARALVEKRADLAVVGAVYIQSDVDFPMVFAQLGALSRGGRSRPFARESDGLLPGEGVGVVVLKRLADAERDGHRIYAVVRGVGLASDGRGPGLATPDPRGHALAMRRAYRRAGIEPAQVDLIEGHGLGVPSADRAELKALRKVFPPSRRRVLGAVSSMIGHAMPAAGMAGLIKTALALHHRLLPPTLHAESPHPLLNDARSPARLNESARPWVHGEVSRPRRRGRECLRFLWDQRPRRAGGARRLGRVAHVPRRLALLGERGHPARCSRPFRLAGTRPRLDRVDRLPNRQHAEGSGFHAQRRTAALSVPGRNRRGLLRGPEGTIALLDPTIERLFMPVDSRCARVRITGPSRCRVRADWRSSSQARGRSIRGCCRTSTPIFRRSSDRLIGATGWRWNGTNPSFRARFFSARRGESSSELWAMGTAVNVVLSAQWGLYQLLTRLGLRPDAVAGHSSGEFLALGAAGALADRSAVRGPAGGTGQRVRATRRIGEVSRSRNWSPWPPIGHESRRPVGRSAPRRAWPWTIARIRWCSPLPPSRPPRWLTASARRGSGLREACRSRGLTTHLRSRTALGPLRQFFRDIPLEKPRVALYSCATAARMSDDPDAIRQLAVEQWARPVAFRPMIEAMHDDGVRLFVEVGRPGQPDRLHRGHASRPTWNGDCGQSAEAFRPDAVEPPCRRALRSGVPIRPDHLYLRRRPERIDLAAP